MRKEKVPVYKAYFGIKFFEDHRNRGEIDAICAALENNGIHTTCIARDVEQWGAVTLPPMELMRKTFEQIDDSDIVVLELSTKGVGLGIEAGYAVAKGKTLVVLIRQGSDISATMQGIADKVIQYERPEDISISAADIDKL